MGVDPGVAKTGWGVLSARGGLLRRIAGGVISTAPESPQVERIRVIVNSLSDVVLAHGPNVACVERVFVNMNAKTTLALGEARGAALAALLSSGIEVVEMSALQIKRAVTGAGRADKTQVAEMVARILEWPDARQAARDETDALACAIAASSPLARTASRLPAKKRRGRTGGVRVRIRRGGGRTT